MTLPPLVGAGSPGGPTGPRDPQTGRFVTRPTPQPQEAEREASRRPRRRARRETTPTPEDQVRSEPQVGGGQVATPPPPEPETRDRPSPVVTPTPTPPPEPEPEVDREAEPRAATLSGEPETPTTATGISVTKSPGPVTHTAQVAGFGPVLTTSGGPKPARSIFDKALDFVPIYGTIRHSRQVAANWENNSNAGRALDVGLLFLGALGDVVIIGGPTVALGAKVVGKGTTAIRVLTNSTDEAVSLMRAGQVDRMVLRAIVGSSDEIADQARVMLDAAPKPSKIRVNVSYKLTPADITAAGSLDDALAAVRIRTRGAEVIASADDVARANPADIVNAVQKANIKSIKVRVEVPKVTQSGADTINAALKDLRAAGSGDRAGVLPGVPAGAVPGTPSVPVNELRKIMNVPSESGLKNAKAAAKVLERYLLDAGVGVEFRFVPSPKLKFKGRTITRELEYVHPQSEGSALVDDIARALPPPRPGSALAREFPELRSGGGGGAPTLTVSSQSGVRLSRVSAVAGRPRSLALLNPLFVPDEVIPGVPESVPTRFPSETESPGGEPDVGDTAAPIEIPGTDPARSPSETFQPRREDEDEDEAIPFFVPDEAIPGVPESVPTRPSETESPDGEPGRREADRPREFPFPGPGPRRGDQPEVEDEPGARPDEVTKPDKTVRPSPGGEPVPKTAPKPPKRVKASPGPYPVPKTAPPKKRVKASPGGDPVPKSPPKIAPKKRVKASPGGDPVPKSPPKIAPKRAVTAVIGPYPVPKTAPVRKTETETEPVPKIAPKRAPTKAKVSIKGGPQQRVGRRTRPPRKFGPPADQAEDKRDVGPKSKTRRFPRTAVFKYGATFVHVDLNTGKVTRTRKRPAGLKRPGSRGKGSTNKTFAITSFDNDPPSERELELGAFKAVVGESGVRFKRKRKRR